MRVSHFILNLNLIFILLVSFVLFIMKVIHIILVVRMASHESFLSLISLFLLRIHTLMMICVKDILRCSYALDVV